MVMGKGYLIIIGGISQVPDKADVTKTQKASGDPTFIGGPRGLTSSSFHLPLIKIRKGLSFMTTIDWKVI